jgi:hypothetical protein
MSLIPKDDGRNAGDSGGKKWVRLSTDKPALIQLLADSTTVIWKHWLPQALNPSGKRGTSIVCPGGLKGECPICKSNKNLADHTKEGKKHNDYLRAQKRFVVPVIEFELEKVCPSCETVYAASTVTCTNCGTDLPEKGTWKPYSRLLEGARAFFEQLELVLSATTDIDGNQVDVKSIPILLKSKMIEGEGGVIRRTTVPIIQQPLKVDISEVVPLSIEDAYTIYTEREIKHLVAGGGLQGIFDARKDGGEYEIEEKEVPQVDSSDSLSYFQ